jgi:TetR/AcrR family transcriptional regulator
MTSASVGRESWVERAVDRSAAVQRSRTRIAKQVRVMLDASRRLIREKDDFTTQELVVEAGVSLQTFYRYFASKDELLLALIADAMTEACDRWTKTAADIPDPMDRLRFYVTAPLERFDADSDEGAGMRFIVSTHWHLHRKFPNELAEAGKPLVDLVLAEVNCAADSGLLNPRNPEWDSWFIVELLRSINHYYAYAAKADDDLKLTKEKLWEFCRTALGAPRG